MSLERATDPRVVWHDAECGGFDADLALWAQLAAACGEPLLELGCGTGRVALHLARRGHRVAAIDLDPVLVEALRERADAAGLEIAAEQGDAAGFELGRRFALILAPMQLIQLLAGPEARASCLRAAVAHLPPGGRLALAIVDGVPAGIPAAPLAPDVRELDGWVYSSLPLGAVRDGDALEVRRLRQTVAPDGRLGEERDCVRLAILSADQLEREAVDAGLRPAGRHSIPPTESHVGSVVVVMEA